MVELLKKGISDLSTITGHRVLRWQVKEGFDAWTQGREDFRSVIIDGGYSEVAKRAGCHSTKEIAKVKSILHVQAFGCLSFADGSRGNMISLRTLAEHRNGEPKKIKIVLGDILLPGHVFSLEKSNRRLIPILNDLPPFYGSPNMHAAQALLQLAALEEISDHSDSLASNGFVTILAERWEELAAQCGVDPQKVRAILELWCDPNEERSFLERSGDDYRISSKYDQTNRFLLSQGEQRLLSSEKGKSSARIKKSTQNTKFKKS